MVIIKFVMVIFLLYLAWLVSMMTQLDQPKPGTNYYLDMSASQINSLQISYRINSVTTALQRPHALEVSCFNDGTPYRVTQFQLGIRGGSTYYMVDGYHRLRYVGYQAVWDGPISMRRLSAPAGG